MSDLFSADKLAQMAIDDIGLLRTHLNLIEKHVQDVSRCVEAGSVIHIG